MKDPKFVFSSVSDSKEINKVLANPTARLILEKIKIKPLSVTQLSNELDKPLTTIDYNLQNLKKAGLVKISKRVINEKGRVVDLWEPEEKFIVISPTFNKQEFLSVLKKSSPYISLCAMFAIFLEWVSRSQTITMAREMNEMSTILILEDSAREVVKTNPPYGFIFFIVSVISIIAYFMIKRKTSK